MSPLLWHGCYDDNWNGVITPDAFTHPAKFSRGLVSRIYAHGLERGYWQRGDGIVDPFGGVALGALDALRLGLAWTGCELEPRFVELGRANIAKWRLDLAMLNGRLGTATLLQGDSRQLATVLGAGHTAATRSSPPYGPEALGHSRGASGAEREAIHGSVPSTSYGQTDGQLGHMPSGSFTAAVSSPPFGEQQSGGGIGAALQGKGNYQITTQRPSTNVGYTGQGASPGQLAAMPPGNYQAAVSSPPYADAVNGTGEGPGARFDHVYHNPDTAVRQSSANGYGATAGQLGAVDADTFWTAARVIVEQTHAVLRPGGVAVWVTKDYVRKGQRVPFSDRWQQLCAAVGFAPLERIHAMLVEEHGQQLDIFGNSHVRRVERKSLFRRLAERKGSPRIDHEDVIIMRRL